MSGSSKTSTLAFTLPISCQICLGKVKQPVVCPNQHVFCKPCMEFWLDRSDHCPACRVKITPENPCRPVLGGLSQQNEGAAEKSTRDMRRTRMEVLFKESEDEIEKYQRQVEILEEENKILSERISRIPTDGSGQSQAQFSAELESSHLKVLTKKLEDATEMYEQVKRETKSLKQENRLFKEENGKISIENHKLKHEVVSRSPRRFGRTTVLAMESQLEKYKKENTALQKALEKSDAYIEDLEKEIERYKNLFNGTKAVSTGDNLTSGTESNTRKQDRKTGGLFLNNDSDSDDIDTDKTKYNVIGKSRYSSKKSEPSNKNDTFEFEMPSPMNTPGARGMSKLSIDMGDTSDDSFIVQKAKKILFGESSNSKEDVREKMKFQVKKSDDTFDDTLESKDEDTTLELPSPVNSAKKKLKYSNSDHNFQNNAQTQKTLMNSGSIYKNVDGMADYMVPSSNLLALAPGPGASSSNLIASAHQFQPNPVSTAFTNSNLVPSSFMSTNQQVPSSFNPVNLVSSSSFPQSTTNPGSFALGLTENKLDMNTSMTPDIEDCMKLFEEAERKVEFRKGHHGSGPLSPSGSEFSQQSQPLFPSTQQAMYGNVRNPAGQRSLSQSNIVLSSASLGGNNNPFSANLQFPNQQTGMNSHANIMGATSEQARHLPSQGSEVLFKQDASGGVANTYSIPGSGRNLFDPRSSTTSSLGGSISKLAAANLSHQATHPMHNASQSNFSNSTSSINTVQYGLSGQVAGAQFPTNGIYGSGNAGGVMRSMSQDYGAANSFGSDLRSNIFDAGQK